MSCTDPDNSARVGVLMCFSCVFFMCFFIYFFKSSSERFFTACRMMGPIASRGGPCPEVLRNPNTTLNFPEGSGPPVSPV